jgi:hypothetical protein
LKNRDERKIILHKKYFPGQQLLQKSEDNFNPLVTYGNLFLYTLVPVFIYQISKNIEEEL